MDRSVRRQTGQLVNEPEATILVVDDDPATAEAVATVVREAGYAPRVATTWSEALRTFLATPIDLVITDAVMPTVDGAKLATLLRGRTSSYVPILMLTSLLDKGAREQAIAAGVDDVLAKPPNPFEIALRIRALLRIRKLTLDLDAKRKELEELARRDPLTGLDNRRSMSERLDHEVARFSRYGHDFSLAVFDLDHFKQVNDSFGHAIGDELLEFFGTTLRANIRTVDFACRYGGEEFVLLMPETPADRALVVVERIRQAFLDGSVGATPAGRQSLSCGYSGTDLFAGHRIEPALLLRTADAALYESKRGGRNRCSCHVEVGGSPERAALTETR